MSGDDIDHIIGMLVQLMLPETQPGCELAVKYEFVRRIAKDTLKQARKGNNISI